MFQKMPNTLVKNQPFFKIPPCLQQRIMFKFNQTLLDWNFMDYIIPDLSMAYNISFDESVMKQNLKKEAQQLTIVFGPNLSPSIGNFFQTLYLRIGAVGLTGNKSYRALKKLFVRLRLMSCPARCQHFWIWISFVLQLVQLKIVRFQSGDYGEYSHLDRLNMVCLTLAEIEVQNAKACVLLNFACICKFEHTDRESGVAVGIVTNQHTSPTTGDFFL